MTSGNEKEKDVIRKLAELQYRHTLLRNEYYHLKQYTSLEEFNPRELHHGDGYEHFTQDFQLWQTGRRARHRDPMKDQIEELSTELHQQMVDKLNKEDEEIESEEDEQQESEQESKQENGKGKEDQDEEESKPDVKPETPEKPKKRARKKVESEEPSEDESEYEWVTEYETDDEDKPKHVPKRIKLNLNPPKVIVTNKFHVTGPKYANFGEFLQSFKSLDEDMTPDEYEIYIEEQRNVYQNIQDALRSGKMKFDEEASTIEPITIKDVTDKSQEAMLQMPTHQDHLINQAVYMSKLFHDSRKARVARARKVSLMIEQHFRHLAGAEERAAREEERRIKTLAKNAAMAVKRRWQVAEKAFRVLKKDEDERLARIKGKEHLSKMLEQSTQLLGAQLNRDTETTGVSESGSDDSDDEDSADEFLSESSDEEEDEKVDDDSKLTVEQLREKYANLPEVTPDADSEPETDQDMSADESETPVEISEEAKKELEKEYQNGNDLLDEDDSEESLSDSSDYSSEEEEDDEPRGSALADLFGTVQEDDDEEFDNDKMDVDATKDESDSVDTEASVKNESDSMDIDSGSTDALPRDAEEDMPAKEVKPDNESLNGEQKDPEDALSVVDVPTPSLLRGTLRTYQKQGLNWLASLYNNNTNGILADEMGLGKTIQTISLLCYLACEKHIWGPHLIIVPTSVLLNWEMEFKRFAPGFKVLTYYGSPQQRKEKRKGWNKPDSFHVCITSYQLVVQDHHSFKRKAWQYMILDEAHNIKNFRSTRWQALLNFNTQRRLLLTGTPLQNNIIELWSLLYFLMPQTIDAQGVTNGFADLDNFQQWFGKPVDKIIESGDLQDDETKKTVAKLHQVLRPYLLRRLKADVEKQMPGKYEHIVYCRLSKRQRFLYDDFMSRAQTKETLASGNFLSIINCLMQLRKVCNHPDLFEVRPILTSLAIKNNVATKFVELNDKILKMNVPGEQVNLGLLNMLLINEEMSTHTAESSGKLQCIEDFKNELQLERAAKKAEYQNIEKFYDYFNTNSDILNLAHRKQMFYLNRLRCSKRPVYGENLMRQVTVTKKRPDDSDFLKEAIIPLNEKLIQNRDIIEKYAVITPKVVTLDSAELAMGEVKNVGGIDNPFHQSQTKLAIAFPDKSLLQYDCGKLQKLATLLRDLKAGGHRALIFTQMTKVLDVLEQFLNYHGYLYMRLDGATKIEDRQILTERFNTDPKITVFILSSRSGGLGINLTGADTVIFYDSDWNPAMDKQCQDRCHRIGQTRDVHIYRFVSEHTIESNILKKANQKRQLDNVLIQKGDFTTDYFTKFSVKDLLGEGDESQPILGGSAKNMEKLLAQAEDEDDAKAANMAMREVAVDDEDFNEQSNANGDTPGDRETTQENDEYEGTGHVEEYMIRYIANGWYD